MISSHMISHDMISYAMISYDMIISYDTVSFFVAAAAVPSSKGKENSQRKRHFAPKTRRFALALLGPKGSPREALFINFFIDFSTTF